MFLLLVFCGVALAGTPKLACPRRDVKFRCPGFVSQADTLSKASDLLRFTFTKTATDSDGTWVWAADAFTAGGKPEDDNAPRTPTCTSPITEVRMINRRRQEDASCNDPQPVNGEELVLSGKCVQTVFYADPCGIRYKSSAQVSLAGKMTFDKWVRDTVSLPDTQVPYFYRVIRRLIRDNNAFDGEGFLRIAGVKDETDRLFCKLTSLNGDALLNFKYFGSPHNIGDALKKALRERETLNGKGPLNAVYEAAKACNEQNEYADCKEKMLPGLLKISQINRGILAVIIQIVQDLNANKEVTKMGIANTARLFAPTFFGNTAHGQFEALDVTTKGQTLFEIMFNAAGAGTRIPRTDPKGENTVLPPCGSGTGGGGEGGRRGGNQGGAQNTAPKKKSRI